MTTKNNIQNLIAERAAKELVGPCIVNLGIGVPTLIPDYLDDDEVYLHTENGMLGVGPEDPDNLDPNLVNAGKFPITEVSGSAYFNSADSFGMIRGGHIDVTVLGVLQADQTGRIANWSIPGKNIIGVGGAMDLLSGAKKVICTMTHTTKTGEAKIVKKCDYPITSTRQIDMLITELAVFTFENDEMTLIELMPGATLEEVQEKTQGEFKVDLQENNEVKE
ncbi:3-oxoacid CoA-transferase subunit B [Fundicoccus culcitae]|uniref:3-oxoacid CoA-transferase subunit B n=1 Tax=Fundicoccus culcitae TaxID=2969821 RepID=A0ABY5P9J4_9LACT|nr:3-oxoacid CoA-transferase subunit B [Fundicoccus culcitae]UUX35088.1 3-oxoacid CoA-transferase subunit B [Fundicoccus culcitae]